jgi:catechol 2,3-dioxygenase-like lactoylglutathione lyase family enzyme
MLTNAALIAFIATAHPDQARVFYSEVLGLPLREESPFALVFDAQGTMLRVQKVDRLTHVGYTVLGWQVDDIREAVEQLQQRGIRFERYPGLLQDEQGIWTTPDGTNIAWFADPDGNTLSLTELRQD